MLDYLAERRDCGAMADAAGLIETAVQNGFAQNRIRPREFGGDMGTGSITDEVIARIRSS